MQSMLFVLLLIASPERGERWMAVQSSVESIRRFPVEIEDAIRRYYQPQVPSITAEEILVAVPLEVSVRDNRTGAPLGMNSEVQAPSDETAARAAASDLPNATPSARSRHTVMSVGLLAVAAFIAVGICSKRLRYEAVPNSDRFRPS